MKIVFKLLYGALLLAGCTFVAAAISPDDYLKAAEQGDATAQYQIGLCYQQGNGVATNNALAAYWYRKAAEQGNSDAQGGMAYLYAAGLGVPQNFSECIKWMLLAAEQGDSRAQYTLGCIYQRQNLAVQKDDIEALKWLSLADTSGYTNTLALREMIVNRLSPEQIVEAQRRIASFRPVKRAAITRTDGWEVINPQQVVKPAPLDGTKTTPFDPDAFLAATPIATPPIPEGFVPEQAVLTNTPQQDLATIPDAELTQRLNAAPVAAAPTNDIWDQAAARAASAAPKPASVDPLGDPLASQTKTATGINLAVLLGKTLAWCAFVLVFYGLFLHKWRKPKQPQPVSSINFACPKCRHPLEAPADMGGAGINCPNCSRPITIPQPDSSTQVGAIKGHTFARIYVAVCFVASIAAIGTLTPLLIAMTLLFLWTGMAVLQENKSSLALAYTGVVIGALGILLGVYFREGIIPLALLYAVGSAAVIPYLQRCRKLSLVHEEATQSKGEELGRVNTEPETSKQVGISSMNQKQLRVLWACIVVVGFLLLFPPWKFTVDIPRAAHIEKPGGYAFIFTPPESTSAIPYDKRYVSVRIDVGRLALPIVVVIMITGALLFTLRGRSDHAPKE